MERLGSVAFEAEVDGETAWSAQMPGGAGQARRGNYTKRPMEEMLKILQAKLGRPSSDARKIQLLEDEIENLRAQKAELEKDRDAQRDLKLAFKVHAVRLGDSLKKVRKFAQEQGLDLRAFEAGYPASAAPNDQPAVNAGRQAEDESQDTDSSPGLKLLKSHARQAEDESQDKDSSPGLKLLKSQFRESGWLLHVEEVELLEPIGSGSTADIFKGVWRGLEVAVKCLRASTFEDNPEGEALYCQEVEVLSRQRHPYVLRMLAASLSLPHHAWIITEYLASGTLTEWLHGTKKRESRRIVPLPSICERLRIAREISIAMQYLHERSPKILHRDLKPSNVFLDMYHHVRVADFSFARYCNPKDGVLTGETGTYVYMAPEVMRHEYYDEKCDVYSFGVMLCEMVTGDHPYIDTPYTPAQIALSAAIGHLRPTLPDCYNRDLVDLIKASWEQEPSKRPSFAEITTTLKAIAKDPAGMVDPRTGHQNPPHAGHIQEYLSGLFHPNNLSQQNEI